MAFLNELINSVSDEDLKEQLQERVSIIEHKIRYTEKIPVACLNGDQQPHSGLDNILALAGGERTNDPQHARVVLYHDYQQGIGALMSKVIPGLSAQWPATQYNRVYLIDDAVVAKEPQYWVECLEDLAEMLHPGYFVFGNEGKNWVNYKA